MNELKRREDESLLQHAKRLVESKFIDRQDYDYVEIYSSIFGIEISTTEARKRLSGLRDLFEQLDNSELCGFSEDELLQEIEEKKLELQKEKIKVQDQKRELNKLVRSEARFEHLVDVLKEEIRKSNEVEPLQYTYKYSELDNEKVNEAVLICSDWHIGAKFDNVLAQYNVDIAKQRIEELLCKTIDYCTIHDVKTLHVELLGDMISGLIHISSKVEAEEDAISQIITLSRLLANFIHKLADKIPYVKVYTAIGNHSRLCPNLKDNQEGENFERLIPFYLKDKLEKVDNVCIDESANLDDCIIQYKVLNTTIFGVHGDLDKPNAVVDNMIKMFKIIPDEIHMGHYHTDMEMTEYDISVIVNGNLQGTDTFAKKIRKSGTPLQKLIIYNEDGNLCEYKIKLK